MTGWYGGCPRSSSYTSTIPDKSSSSRTSSRTKCARCPGGTNSSIAGGSNHRCSGSHARNVFAINPSASASRATSLSETPHASESEWTFLGQAPSDRPTRRARPDARLRSFAGRCNNGPPPGTVPLEGWNYLEEGSVEQQPLTVFVRAAPWGPRSPASIPLIPTGRPFIPYAPPACGERSPWACPSASARRQGGER